MAAAFALSACTSGTPGPQAIETILEPTEIEVQNALGENELPDGAVQVTVVGSDEGAAETALSSQQVTVQTAPPIQTQPLALVPAQPARRNPLAAFLRGNEAGNASATRQRNVQNEPSFGFGLTAPSDNALPGVNAPINVAAVPNMARRGQHGILTQRPDVKVHCFPRNLRNILKQVERRFGRAPVVTSGYRSPRHNRKIRGARNSHHTRCTAADIQVKGVSKWTLARYLRSIPGRGGVGTYCHTKSVHIDVGTKRDWNSKCRRRSKKRT